ncbi:hypothetical protein DR093_01105 [Mycoplasma flocculare]|uniref:trypsin-like peptidase domain-containing protein n=1 Tax=Mesomycoplasma flocculare TaxID=2128 RepID=UPI00136CDBE5|nr:trypsin-like peptidase domain-containing protein [Mesomycoplasma flocculare]MXR12183.1 hypothetical protein [Mesomycoplasma flocculare]
MNWKKLFISFSYLLFLPLTIVSCFDFKTGNVKAKVSKPVEAKTKPLINIKNKESSQNELNPKITPENKGDFFKFSENPFNLEKKTSPEINGLDSQMLKRLELDPIDKSESQILNDKIDQSLSNLEQTKKNTKNTNTQNSKSELDRQQIEINYLIEKPVLEKSQIENLDFSALDSFFEQKPISVPKKEKPVDANFFSEEEFQLINERSINNFNISGLSELDHFKTPNIGLDKAFTKTVYEPFQIETHTGIKKENDTVFLGQKNENLNIYLLDKLSQHNISANSPAKQLYHSYYNPNFTRKYFKPKYFGFKSLDYNDTRYLQAYQRNIRFAPGTAILLDSQGGESLFLTNAHVLYIDKVPFWEKPSYPFMRFYYNNKVNDLGSLGYLGILSLFWIKQEYDKKITELKKKEKDFSQKNHHIYIGSATPKMMWKFSIDLHKNYFRLGPNFNNHGKDLGIFYFNHGKFTHDIEAVLEFYEKHRQSLLSQFRFSNGESIDKGILEFKNQFKTFQQFWEQAKKFPPLKIAERIWKNGEIDYTTKIGGFWPQFSFAKNMFKGVYINNGSPHFFATNGPGASGSGIFNANGELVFINQLIVLSKDQKKLYYDQNNLTSHLAIGILFRDGKSDLVSEIKKFYYKNKEEQNETEQSQVKVTEASNFIQISA